VKEKHITGGSHENKRTSWGGKGVKLVSLKREERQTIIKSSHQRLPKEESKYKTGEEGRTGSI